MLALLKKDLFVLKRMCSAYVALLLFYVVFGVVNGNFSMFQVFFAVLMLTTPVSSMSIDEKCGWDVYGMSLPVSRKTMVLSKYLLTGCMMVFGVASCSLATAVYAVAQREPLTWMALVQPLLISCGALLSADVGLPLMYKFGTEKGRYMMVGLIWGVALVLFALVKVKIEVYAMAENAVRELGENAVPVLAAGVVLAAAVATVVATVVSVVVSIAVYERKDLG